MLLERNFEEDIKKYLGLPPYDKSTNIVKEDSLFLSFLYSRYGKQKVQAEIFKKIL